MRFVLIGAVAALAGLFLLADEAHAQSLQCRQQITPGQREACAEGPMTEARRVLGAAAGLRFAEGAMAALDGADALVIVTEWKEFRSPDFARIGSQLKQPVIFDGRNMFSPDTVVAAGIEYHAIGRIGAAQA